MARNHNKLEERKIQNPRDKRLEISNEEIVKVFKKKGCNINETCEALGITRVTFYRWRDADPELDRMIQEAAEALIDFAECQLMKLIKAGDAKSIIFFLKTKGKHRGYVESTEITGNLNGIQLRPLTNEELDELKNLNK